MTPTLLAAGYCRSGLSSDPCPLPGQIDQILSHATKQEMRLTAMFADYAGVGPHDRRLGLTGLLAAVEDGSVNVVVVASMDRLSRNIEELRTLLYFFRENGVALHVAGQGPFDPLSMGRSVLAR